MRVSTQKANSGEYNSPAASAGIRIVGKRTGLMVDRLRVRIPGRSGWRIFFSSLLFVLTLIRCPFHLRVTAVVRKRPRSFCQKCKWQVTPKHAYTLDPTKLEWADYSAVQA